MSMIISELREFIGFGLRGQKFIPKHVQKWKKMRVSAKGKVATPNGATTW